MNIIQPLTSNALQKMSLVLDDGSVVKLTIYFVPMQQGWVITELTWNTFTLRGLRICNNPNMLHQFKNQITFGLGCFSTGNREPSLQQDFSSGASKLYILTSDEVDAYGEYLSNG